VYRIQSIKLSGCVNSCIDLFILLNITGIEALYGEFARQKGGGGGGHIGTININTFPMTIET
jgi:hypothetical protein